MKNSCESAISWTPFLITQSFTLDFMKPSPDRRGALRHCISPYLLASEAASIIPLHLDNGGERRNETAAMHFSRSGAKCRECMSRKRAALFSYLWIDE